MVPLPIYSTLKQLTLNLATAATKNGGSFAKNVFARAHVTFSFSRKKHPSRLTLNRTFSKFSKYNMVWTTIYDKQEAEQVFPSVKFERVKSVVFPRLLRHYFEYLKVSPLYRSSSSS